MRTLSCLIWVPFFVCSCCFVADCQVYRVPRDEMVPGYARGSIRSQYGGYNVAVSVRVTTDKLGHLTHARAFEGPKPAYHAAEEAERGLRFEPFVRNGKAVGASFIDEVWLLPPEAWLTPRVPFPYIRDSRSLLVKMEKRAWCFEPRCSSYEVEVHGDGQVRLLQRRFTFRNPKTYTGIMPIVGLTSLVDEFRKADFFSLKPAYVTDVTDCQGTIVSIAFDGRSKSVSEYCGVSAGAPRALFNLEKRIDEIVKTKQWLGNDFQSKR